MNKTRAIMYAIAALITLTIFYVMHHEHNTEAIIAIINYGPHSSLEDTIAGIRETINNNGFTEGEDIKYIISDTGFDPTLIPQTVNNAYNQKPKVVVALTTPVAQLAKSVIHDIPLIYGVISNPVEAGLIKDPSRPDGNVTGVADTQDLTAMIQFAKTVMPHVKSLGMLYATSESNDIATLKAMEKAAKNEKIVLIALPIEHSRDIPSRMTKFKNKVDFIYVGASGPVQPALPIIAAEADAMGIPVINLNEEAVKSGLVMASFGVNYIKIGNQIGNMVSMLLHGVDITQIPPIYPRVEEHIAYINMPKARNTKGVKIPENMANLTLIDCIEQ